MPPKAIEVSSDIFRWRMVQNAMCGYELQLMNEVPVVSKFFEALAIEDDISVRCTTQTIQPALARSSNSVHCQTIMVLP